MKIYEATIADLDGVAELFNNYRMFYGQESNVEEAKSFFTKSDERKRICHFCRS